MLFARMRDARCRSFGPTGEFDIALRFVQGRRFAEPCIKCFCIRGGLRRESTKVVEGHSAADDEDALIAQWTQRLPYPDMFRRVQSSFQRELHCRHIGFRISQLERNKSPVVESAFGICRCLEFPRFQKLAHTPSEIRITWSRPLYRVG